jgi:FtsZ-interacting cell division protein YlmF
MFAYNSFQSKLKEIKKMAELDEKQDFYDEYDIVNYENPSKRLIKK